MSEIARRIRSLMPPGVVFAGGAIHDAQQPLYPEEDAAIRNAVHKRRAEFRAGRTYARAALRALGVAPVPIPAGADRVPVWPAGVAASITHDDTFCGVMAARTADFAAVGIDVDSAAPLDDDLIGYICGAAELEHHAALGASLAVDFPKLIFCAKESAYKAYFALTRTVLEFDDVDVRVTPHEGSFSATVRASAPALPGGERAITGRFAAVEGHLVTWVTVPARH
jgi:4'-phosphopantetheinyl transferase EntD